MNTTPEKESAAEVWQRIGCKSHLYETAWLIEANEYVKILGLRCPGTFVIRRMDGSIEDRACNDMNRYGL